jgi:glycosyltransferase involved in cell wall biosynthesis
VISSSHAVAKAMVRRGGGRNPIHICYIHTPMRYVWDRFDDYFGSQRVGRFLSFFFFRPIAKLLQIYDRRTVKRVDTFVANSNFVADRVMKLYGRKAEVVPPPVDLELFQNTKRAPEDWYLMVTALVPYKKVEEAIVACQTMNRKLKIVGSGPEEKKLKTLARNLKANVEFLGFVDDFNLATYYSKARALIFPGVEDFGIVPVEALASGCPVIALKIGGVLDSLNEETAVLYNDPTEKGLTQAIQDFEGRFFDENKLRVRASLFSQENFLARFERVFDKALAEHPL